MYDTSILILSYYWQARSTSFVLKQTQIKATYASTGDFHENRTVNTVSQVGFDVLTVVNMSAIFWYVTSGNLVDAH
jgi:hypothetical protein